MVEFAEEHNPNPAIEYIHADITERTSLRQEWKGAFDLLTAFLVFHWVEDQSVALRNVRYLLKPDAEILLYLAIKAPDSLLKIGPTLKESPKWNKYLKVSASKFLLDRLDSCLNSSISLGWS